MNAVFHPTVELARKLIFKQFPEFNHLSVIEVEKQGHDNRTFRLGSELLIRMPTAEDYVLKVPKEQELLIVAWKKYQSSDFNRARKRTACI